uniref:Uncharacterized protein n=1 Tax=Borrelia garinii subsp. bavariensis (strain ATCC BAA-2496 / DSM 23469 / PBi) TaxID=290434 RepID=A0A7I6GX74_BORGP|nr:hypothetical protein BGP029 [Borreliella bavariensis PBi]
MNVIHNQKNLKKMPIKD